MTADMSQADQIHQAVNPEPMPDATPGATPGATPAATPADAQPAQTLAAMERQYEAEIAAIEDDLLGEIERTRRSAAERERALVAERDAYRAQLAFATDTKAWRASLTYWRARERGLPGAFWLAGQLATYLARVGYHLGVPYPLRRDLWYRRHTGMSYRGYFRMLGAADASARAEAAASSQGEPASVRKAVGPDVLYFPAHAWEATSAAERRVALALVETGHRCRWVNPQLAAGSAPEVMARSVGAGDIEELTLPGYGGDVATQPGAFRRSALRRALTALTSFCYERDLREVVCVVRHPGWAPLVDALRLRYGWKVVYDLTGDTQEDDARIERVRASGDLALTDAPAECERLQARGLRVALILADGAGEHAVSALDAAVRSMYGQVTIIIVTYRNLDKTRLTLKSILEKTRYPNYDVLLVDNGGQPDILAYTREMTERFPGVVRSIVNAENLGFAGGNNVGLRASKESDIIVLLNDDVLVTPGWLGGLVRYLADPRIGMVGPVTNSCGNEARITVDYSDTSEVDAFARRYTREHEGASFDIPMLAMYCVAMRQQVAAQIGELDERFRVGMFEDDDYAMRLHDAGYRLVCAEDIYAHHFGSSSFGKLSEEQQSSLFEANRALFEQKWRTTWRPHKYREG